MSKPKISIIIPIHDMNGGAQFLWDSINAIMGQTFQDYEIIITKNGKMAENTNSGIKKANGDIIKILFLDDRLAHKYALSDIVREFEDTNTNWLITGVNNNTNPYWTDDIETGNNRLGSPSALAFRNDDPLLFDERMSWLLDCDLYKRLHDRYGPPQILEGTHVMIGIGEHQTTNILTADEKLAEHQLMKQKYG